MVLSMSRPWKHPTTGVYYYRRAIPDDLRTLIGRREEKRSLNTKDPATAKASHATVAAEVEARWANLRRGFQVITAKQAHAIAGEFYRQVMAGADDPDIEQEADAVLLVRAATWTNPMPAVAAVQARIRDRVLPSIEGFLSARGILTDASGKEKIREAVEQAMRQGHETLLRHAEGDWRPDPDADRFPPVAAIEPTPVRAPVLTSKDLFDAYQSEAKTAPSTEKKWRGIFAALVRFVGHDDMRRVTEDDVLRWKNVLLAGGASNKHVRNSHLAALNGLPL